jgi:hypothetical protein
MRAAGNSQPLRGQRQRVWQAKEGGKKEVGDQKRVVKEKEEAIMAGSGGIERP